MCDFYYVYIICFYYECIKNFCHEKLLISVCVGDLVPLRKVVKSLDMGLRRKPLDGNLVPKVKLL